MDGLEQEPTVVALRSALKAAFAESDGPRVVVVAGSAGVGTTAVADAAIASVGRRVTRWSPRSDRTLPKPQDPDDLLWVDDAQRLEPATVVLLADVARSGAVLLSGRWPLGEAVGPLVSAAIRRDPGYLIRVPALSTAAATDLASVWGAAVDPQRPDSAARIAADAAGRPSLVRALTVAHGDP